jgi:hypothetical protein
MVRLKKIIDSLLQTATFLSNIKLLCWMIISFIPEQQESTIFLQSDLSDSQEMYVFASHIHLTVILVGLF